MFYTKLARSGYVIDQDKHCTGAPDGANKSEKYEKVDAAAGPRFINTRASDEA